jgi:dienelactone hydrolase
MAGVETLERIESAATIPIDGAELEASLAVPDGATGVVVFAHGSGSGRFSPRNRQVAAALADAGFGTLLVDLLTDTEERYDRETAELRFDIDRLAARLVRAIDWLEAGRELELPVGGYGASTGAAAALIAAAERPQRVRAVVSRGGRPDLARDGLRRVRAPTLLIVGERDPQVLDLNREAAQLMSAAAVELEVVPAAGHLFEEAGALERVSELTVGWFGRHLAPGRRGA